MLQGTIGSKFTAGVLCIFLAACGGGGGDSGKPSPQAGTVGTTGTTGATGVTESTGTPVSSGSPAATGSTGTAGAATGTGTTGTTGSATPPAAPASSAQQVPQPPVADATRARFNGPVGIALDGTGNLYIADALNHTIRRIATSGVVTTLAGSPGISGSADGRGAQARFSALKGIAVDGDGNVYAVDNGAIRRIAPNGTVTTLAGASGLSGDADGPGTGARFRQPWGIAADARGTLYVADTGNYLVRKVAPDGTVSTHAGTRGMRGTANGTAATATFLGPMGVALDGSGNLFLTDWYGPPAPNLPEGSTFIRRIAADGSVTTLAGNFGGETGPAAFSDTFALAADAQGDVYIAAANSVRRLAPNGTITAVAGSGGPFQVLNGIAIDNSGNLFVTDESNHTVSKVTQSGAVTLIAGKSGESGSVDEPAAP